MKHFSIALIYIAFFGLIGFAVYFTNTVAPLWALLLTPTYKNADNE
jgi:preprotein translocase subunit Sss1